MLDHIGQPKIASLIHNGWLKTLEEGIHTYDIYKEGTSKKKVGTQEFGEAVIKNLGKKPDALKPALYGHANPPLIHTHIPTNPVRHLVGVDVFIFFRGQMEQFFPKISHINIEPLHLKMITNRGTRVWPGGQPETFCTEQWRCRFTSENQRTVSQHDIIQILHSFDHVQMDVIKAECLYTFDGKPGYSSAEG
jgi:isocitrate dehydrogenase